MNYKQPQTAHRTETLHIMCPTLRFGLNLIGWLAILAGVGGVGCPSSLRAQDRTVLFDVAAAGVSKSIPTWGLDTAWLNSDNVRRGVVFMGQPQVDVIRFSFTGDTPISGGNLSGTGLTEFNTRMGIVNSWADSHTQLYLNNDTASLDVSYQGSGGVNAAAWAQLIAVTKSNCVAAGRTVISVSPFNEPDYGTWQGDSTRLGQVCSQLRTTFGASFTGIRLSGGNTLNNDVASGWYTPLNAAGYLEEGCTHQLAGSFDNYAAFFQTVQANGDLGANDELHNVMEAMVGAEYGMGAGIWWGTAERARGEFVRTSDGVRLGYAEHRPNWTAASVYRGTNGGVKAFVGESERQALPTTYRFFSKDRDVFYDGDGPRRDYTVTTTGGAGYQTANHRNAERVVNINWGADVPPLINGRYFIVARHSSKVMEVASASTADGANIQQNAYSGALNQQWDVTPLPATSGGDYSYFSITAAHSGKAPDVFNFSYNDGGDVRQYGLPGSFPGVNQQWYFEYVSNGWFNVRSRWSGKYLDVSGVSTANGANIQQWSGTGGLNQQWRFIPVGASPTDVSAPAAVTGLSATANPRSVRLTWSASPWPDLAGYTVLRATISGGPYEIIARGLTNTAFTDKSANLPRAYYYVVKAVDKSWNASVNSAQVSATPTALPALVAHYPFEGNLGDSSLNANHPIVTNGSPAFMASPFGTALDLDGVSQSTLLPANLLAGVSNFSIAVWVNWDGGGDWQRIFDFGNGPAQNMFLTPRSGGGTLRFAITTNNYWNEQSVEAALLPIGQWQHVAVTYNGSQVRLYTNGVLAAANAMTLTPASFNPALNYLGDSQYDGDPLFNGRLDELFIYNYALSATEILRLTANQPPPPVMATTLIAVSAGNTINFSWPSNYLGCRLESNSVSLAAPGSWFNVPGSANSNRLTLPLNVSSSNVFFRLVYP